MIIDMHIHSYISPCSHIPINEMIKTAYTKGLDGICITDHDTMTAKKYIKGMDTYGLTVIVGMEYSTPQGDFLLFGLRQDIHSGLSACELLETVNQVGGIAIAAHPFRFGRKIDHSILPCINIIEGINARCTQEENDLSMEWGTNYGKKIVGGSDAHTLLEIGKVVTYFDKPIYNEYDLVEQIIYGDYYPLIRETIYEVHSYNFRWIRR